MKYTAVMMFNKSVYNGILNLEAESFRDAVLKAILLFDETKISGEKSSIESLIRNESLKRDRWNYGLEPYFGGDNYRFEIMYVQNGEIVMKDAHDEAVKIFQKIAEEGTIIKEQREKAERFAEYSRLKEEFEETK